MELCKAVPFSYFYSPKTGNIHMKKALILVGIGLMSLQLMAQRPKVNDARQYWQFEEFAKAKKAIDEAVKHESTKDYDKAWLYRGDIYKTLALIKLNSYKFKREIDSAKIKEYANLSDNPIKEAFESYQNCIKYDDRGRREKEANAGMADLVSYQFNYSNFAYQDAIEKGTGKIKDPSLMVKAYNEYQDFFKYYEQIPEKNQKLFKATLMASEISLKDVQLTMANAAFYGQDYDNAIKEYEKLVAENIDDYLVYRNLSKVYVEKGMLDKAKQLWDTATEAFPENKEITLDEAIFYQEIGETDMLMTKLDEAIALDPENASLYNVLGGIYVQLVVNSNNAKSEDKEEDVLPEADKKMYFEKAEEMLKKAQELNPTEISNYTQLATLYLSEGFVYYNENQNLGISQADIKKSKVLTEKYKKYFNLSSDNFQKALEINDENLFALKQLKRIFTLLGDLQTAQEYSNRITELERVGSKEE